ncbi:putative F-box protein At1g49610 [Nicotiana sylvestris]|nr:PREDICTED: putative F-box protein At1g49610 [Nicotiana sylvestris]XP_009767813.1 PREDICTED: putative F-box protein At1g49610 [Nicotiana sylvestris]XP_009767814.1 PREDICTED: putative F-box protein At1g49610 [Nicotiana sylvestris]XP_009767815.1 PREDICTED: putative F-box protein At1g49610 [Nicotiana sylvestris]
MSARQRSCNFNEDRISGLPDAILIHILSLLPTIESVNTILIRRFNHLWPFIHKLTFDQCMFPGHNCVYYSQANRPDYDERFLNFVRHVLLLNKSPTLYKFSLDFHFSLSHSIRQRVSNRTDRWQYDCLRSEKRMANEIGTWIQFALNKNLKVLDLSFSAHGTFEPQAYYDLPNFVLSSPHLVELRLAYCKINTKKKSDLKALTTFSLDNVMLMDQSMDYILSGCPVLEELTLWFCYGHRRLVLVNSNLKTLVLGIRWFGTRIHVSAPTLLSLEMSGTVEVLDITNVASIVEVSVNRMEKYDFKEYKDYQEMRILLQTITGAKSLKLCSWFALVFSSWQLTNLPAPTFSCKALNLQLDFVKWHLPGILNLLKHCPCLENLIIEITAYYDYPSRNATSWIHPYDFDGDEFWNMVDTPVQCLTHHLKTVEVAGFVMEKHVIHFVEYLLRSSMVLEEMVIFAEKQTWIYGPITLMSGKVQEFEERLINAPKASASAAVVFY